MKRTSFGKIARSLCAAAVMVGGASAQAALVGFWDFEDTLIDVSGNGNNGTAGGAGAPTFSVDTPGVLGASTKSLNFAGDQHVLIANEQNFDLGNNMTVSTWVKGGLPGTWEPFISKNGEPNGWQLRRHAADQTIDFTTRRSPNNDVTDFASTNDAAGQIIGTDPNEWHHIVGTFDGSVKKIYIDGVLNNVVHVNPGAISDSPAQVIFGGRQNPGPGVGNTSFNGNLDNVAIYSDALSANQVAFLAAGGNPMNLPAADAPPVTFTWDFGANPTLQDWTVINGVAHFRAGDGDGLTPGNSGGGFAHDGAHANLLVRSPLFHFNGDTVDGLNAIVIEFAGGAGNQPGSNLPAFFDAEAAINYNGGNTDANGAKAVGILNLSTNTYMAFLVDPSDGNVPAFATMTLAQLATFGIEKNTTYRLDFFENDQGSWGWSQLNSIQVAGNLGAYIPEPTTAMLGMIGLGLMGLRRRRQA